MKKQYISPMTDSVRINGRDEILQSGIIIGSNGSTVDDEEDIGFVKEERGGSSRGGGRGVWDDDWSKQ